jgi:hypothetical protein
MVQVDLLGFALKRTDVVPQGVVARGGVIVWRRIVAGDNFAGSKTGARRKSDRS